MAFFSDIYFTAFYLKIPWVYRKPETPIVCETAPWKILIRFGAGCIHHQPSNIFFAFSPPNIWFMASTNKNCIFICLHIFVSV